MPAAREVPRTKSQEPNKAAKYEEDQTALSFGPFFIWSLDVVWFLALGSWNFVLGTFLK
jgi:hypothetical protein